MNHDHAPADWFAGLAGVCFSIWQWATAGMSPLSAMVAVLSLVLILLRVRESVARYKIMRQFSGVNKGVIRRIMEAIQTKPGDL